MPVKRFPDYYEAEPREHYSYRDSEGQVVVVHTCYVFGIAARYSGGWVADNVAGTSICQQSFDDGTCFFGFAGEYLNPENGKVVRDRVFSILPRHPIMEKSMRAHEQAAREYLARWLPYVEPRWMGLRYGTSSRRTDLAVVDRYLDLRMTPKWGDKT